MKLALIVAMTETRVIGRDNRLPWHISDDLKRFKQLTLGHPIIMGRKTFESIGRPLPGRTNIVLSRQKDYKAEGIQVVPTLDAALELAAKEHPAKAFIIGGHDLFKMALPQADYLYLTIIHYPFEGDVYFPEFSLQNDYTVIDKSEHVSSNTPPLHYTNVTAERRRV